MLLKRNPDNILGQPVETNFLFWMGIGTTLDNIYYTDIEKTEIVLQSVFDRCPYDHGEAQEWYIAVIDFYVCGYEDRGLSVPKEQLIDWEYDSNTIWADFLLWYGVDLEKVEYLHWWDFRSMFASLPADSAIKNDISIRNDDLSDYSGKNQEKLYRKKEEQKRARAIHPPRDLMEDDVF